MRFSTKLFFLCFLSCLFFLSNDLIAQGDDFEKDIMSMFADSGKDIWIHNYSGKINNVHKIKLGLGYDGNLYKGIYQYQSSGTYFYLEGSFSGDQLVLQEIDTKDFTTGYLILKKENNNWTGEWKNLDKSISFPISFQHERLIKFQKIEQSDTQNTFYEYADFYVRIEWGYPNINNEAFNKWMNEKIVVWKRATKNEIEKLKIDENGLTSSDRFKYEASVWPEISCSNEKVISGKFLIQKNWDSEVGVETFHFDLEKNKDIEIESLFKSKLSENLTVIAAIAQNIDKIKKEENELVSGWISSDLFKYYTLGQNGLIVSTGFNTIFGSKSLTIPYTELKDVIKRTGIIKSFGK